VECREWHVGSILPPHRLGVHGLGQSNHGGLPPIASYENVQRVPFVKTLPWAVVTQRPVAPWAVAPLVTVMPPCQLVRESANSRNRHRGLRAAFCVGMPPEFL